MNSEHSFQTDRVLRLRPSLAFLCCIGFAWWLPALRAAETGSLFGTVNNTATGDLLEGAKISVPQLGLTALTDNTGRFTLPDVPPGSYNVTASYVGLDSSTLQVSIGPGQRALRNFEL